MTPTYAWTVYATGAAALLALIGMLARVLFAQTARIDRLTDGLGQLTSKIGELAGEMRGGFAAMGIRFDRVEDRLGRVEATQRGDKAEVLERLDVLAERITRLERRP